MNIGMFTETYLPNVDGVVRHITNTKQILEQLGHNVYVFAPGTLKDKKNNKDNHVFYYLGTPFPPYPQYKIALFPFISQKRLNSLKIDIIHTHGMATMGLLALQAKTLLNKPLIGTFHTLVTEATHYVMPVKKLESPVKKILWNYLKWYYNHCEVTVSPSTSIKEELIKNGIKKVEVVYPGIDTTKFSPMNYDQNFKKRYSVEDKKVILHVGRVAKEKNIEIAIDSVALLDQSYALMIVGDGPHMKKLRAYVKKKKLTNRVIFTGKVDDNELKKAYASCDCLVFPSTFETFGLVAVEAMASGTPVVGANSTGLRDVIVNNKTGYLVKPHSVE
ncbi:MAG: glycosyltransferase, partial [Candidatus Micrarchaeota archaeon]|nr:glycosyltransferase [Candidatus Micrarchaeota archaeon]